MKFLAILLAAIAVTSAQVSSPAAPVGEASSSVVPCEDDAGLGIIPDGVLGQIIGAVLKLIQGLLRILIGLLLGLPGLDNLASALNNLPVLGGVLGGATGGSGSGSGSGAGGLLGGLGL